MGFFGVDVSCFVYIMDYDRPVEGFRLTAGRRPSLVFRLVQSVIRDQFLH